MARPLSASARTKSLEAAQNLLVDVGVDGFTIDEVARRSGVAKSTIYRHWPNSGELLIAAADGLVVPFATPDTGSLRSDLREFVLNVTAYMGDDSMRQLCLGVMSAAAGDPEFARVHQDFVDGRREPLRSILERAQIRGEIPRELNLVRAVTFVEGPFFIHTVVRGLPMTKESAEELLDLVIAGLTCCV